MSHRIFAVSENKVVPVALSGLTPIGGAGATGAAIAGLKHRGDYAILAPQGAGVAIHALRGKAPLSQVLGDGDSARIDDLTVFVMRDQAVSAATMPEADIFSSVLGRLAAEQGTEGPLEDVLKELIRLTQLEKGLVITKDLSGGYAVLVSQNLDKNDNWLSESLIQQALTERKPMLLQNIVGTSFDTKASLVATGFLSVFCWPLLVQGQTLGLIVTGSKRPHGGLSEGQKKVCETLVHLASMITHFRLKELNLKRAIQELRAKRDDIPLLTDNARLKETCELARKVASSDLAVLVQGETGVGKEVLSRWIHDQSDRKSGPFIAVNCSAIPRELLESVLFGHRKGAFTGAHADQIGKIQQADGGTLFLDEIGDLPLDLQAKLLRVLQDKSVEPVGSLKPQKVDVRILSATHKSVKELVEKQKFREDLYYRLAEMTLWIPPLRERPGDIRLLAYQFLRELDGKLRITDRALVWLIGQAWKGNTRELKSAIKRATLLAAGDEIDVEQLTRGSEASSAPAQTPLSPEKNWLGGETLEEAKQAFVAAKVRQALELTGGNRTKAADLLGVTPRTLFRYLETETMNELS